MLNYFELMGMPTEFALNSNMLQANLRALQSQFHPDSQPMTTDAQTMGNPVTGQAVQLLANLTPEQQSAVINEAYQALVWPDTRAKHLLTLQGIEQSINQPIRDLDFLDEAMNFRIALDEATLEGLDKLRPPLASWLDKWSQVFVVAYGQLVADRGKDIPVAERQNVNSRAIEVALDSLQKLQFLVKLAKDVDKRHDALAQPVGSDDDLYV